MSDRSCDNSQICSCWAKKVLLLLRRIRGLQGHFIPEKWEIELKKRSNIYDTIIFPCLTGFTLGMLYAHVPLSTVFHIYSGFVFPSLLFTSSCINDRSVHFTLEYPPLSAAPAFSSSDLGRWDDPLPICFPIWPIPGKIELSIRMSIRMYTPVGYSFIYRVILWWHKDENY